MPETLTGLRFPPGESGLIRVIGSKTYTGLGMEEEKLVGIYSGILPLIFKDSSP